MHDEYHKNCKKLRTHIAWNICSDNELETAGRAELYLYNCMTLSYRRCPCILSLLPDYLHIYICNLGGWGALKTKYCEHSALCELLSMLVVTCRHRCHRRPVIIVISHEIHHPCMYFR